MREAGHTTLEPIEVYEDPLKQKGYRADHDITDPAVRSRLLDQARELPGPNVPNVYHFGTPCTSYCDFNLLNGGTRTYDQPQGDSERRTQSEIQGNLFCDFTCDLCLEAYNHDKEFVVENTMPTGRYPKLWDQPAMQRLQKATGALFVPAHLCEWGLSPPDQPDKRYKKGQWNLVSPGIYAYALLLARPCQRNHQHEQVKGSAPTGGYPRTREAQVYPEATSEFAPKQLRLLPREGKKAAFQSQIRPRTPQNPTNNNPAPTRLLVCEPTRSPRTGLRNRLKKEMISRQKVPRQDPKLRGMQVKREVAMTANSFGQAGQRIRIPYPAEMSGHGTQKKAD